MGPMSRRKSANMPCWYWEKISLGRKYKTSSATGASFQNRLSNKNSNIVLVATRSPIAPRNVNAGTGGITNSSVLSRWTNRALD